MTEYTQHIHQMLLLGKKLIQENPHKTQETGTINPKGDKSLKIDLLIEDALISYVKKQQLPFNIFSEEIGTITYHPKATHLLSFDPLDGSINYKIGKNILPYGLLISCFKGLTPRLGDICSAGAIEYTNNLTWLYEEGRTIDGNKTPTKIKNDWQIDRTTPFYLDLYYEQGYKAYHPLSSKLFIRNSGSTIGNLSYLLSNIAAGIGGVCMRPEEIGAIVALVTGADGIAIDHHGRDLQSQLFSPDSTYQVLAGSKEIINFTQKNL